MSSENSSYKAQIVVAVIGLVGVLGGALIANWDKLSSRQQVVPPPPVSGKPSIPAPSSPTVPSRSSVAPPPAVQRINISGEWRDLNLGTISRVSQDGSTFRFTAFHPTFDSTGRGTIRGHTFESMYETRYKIGGASTGSCVGEFSADGLEMISQCNDSVRGTWVSRAVR
jgi:hypothetical protein